VENSSGLEISDTDTTGSPSPEPRQGKASWHVPGCEGARRRVRPIAALKEVVPTQRNAPVAHRTPTLAGGPTGDRQQAEIRGQAPLTLQKRGGALGALAAVFRAVGPRKRGSPNNPVTRGQDLFSLVNADPKMSE
jgi:hypothetical protein